MSDAPARDGSDPERLRRVDAVCNRFENLCRDGLRPQIEEFLARVPEDDHAALLRELIPLDGHYRTSRGESPTPADYLARFPGHAALVARLFAAPVPAATIDHIAPPAPEPAELSRESPRPVVPGYEILGVLGRGGMGVVYKARDLRLDRVVALKMVLGGAHVGPGQLTRILAEAKATARMQHPGIVHIGKVGEADGLPYLELEYVVGGSLADQIGDRPQPPRDAARMVEQLARAVAYAHGRNIVHRDLKPANVLLTETGEPKIADFGLAKLTDSGIGPTVSGEVFGTPAYMAPEQARGDTKNVGPAADVYALGVILFQLLTGRVPFEAESTVALLRKVEREEPPSPRGFRRDVPPDLEAVCLKCLEKEPGDRYPSAAALAEDLHCFLNTLPLKHARRTTVLGKLRRRCRRNPAASLWVAAVVVALAAAGLAFAPSAGRDDSLKSVRRSGELVVGVDPIGAPYSFSGKDGKPAGIDVDVARAVAGRLGVSARHIKLVWDWDAMVRQLDERKIDALITCVTITEERGRQVGFVEYGRDPFVFAARPDAGIRTRDDLTGKTLVVQQGTAAQQVAQRLQGEGVRFEVVREPTVPDTFAAVRDGRADAVLEHARIVRHHAALAEPRLAVSAAHGIDPTLADQRLGIALRRDAEALRGAITEAVAAMERDGSLKEIFDRWEPR